MTQHFSHAFQTIIMIYCITTMLAAPARLETLKTESQRKAENYLQFTSFG